MPISSLDVKTVKLITTTQIVTSVYAAVKELVENALDADANNLEINLIDDGTSLIEAKDNGCGISKEDAPCMGLPSHTSKISSFEDLDALRTFGFRGEALSALCTVAEVTIITKTEEDTVGSSYTMNQNGRIDKHEPCHRSTGTTVQVRDLFKRIPVRRQMIIKTRRASQDVKSLETLLQGFGICRPNVRIQFRANNSLVFTKPGLNNIKEAVNHVLGRKITSVMEWIEPKDTEFVLQLMLPSRKVQDLSEVTHAGLQYIFVNDRPIKHKDLEKIVNNLILEYFQQESHRRKVIFLVYIVLKPMDIDVNLEPNKDAILFKDQNKVLDTIDKCVRKFYGLKFMEVSEQNVSNDTSACYEDYTLNLDEAVENEWPACKRRKVHNQEKVIQEDTAKGKSTPVNHSNAVANGHGEVLRDKQTIILTDDRLQDDNQISDQQEHKDRLSLTRIQPLNLSDSDSNDEFPPAISSNIKEEVLETFSQLPVVDLGEDFDFTEKDLEIGSCDTTIKKNEDNLNKVQEKKQLTLETWSKGHIAGLKGGIDIKSDIAIERQLNDDPINRHNVTLESNRAHVDRNDLNFLKHVRSQVAKENPTLTTIQTAKKITEFWKQMSSEERGYYRDIAQENERGYQEHKKPKDKTEAFKVDAENNKSRLLQLFEKMKNMKNERKEKKEKSNVRTVVPWIIDKDKIITRSDFEIEHVVGRLTPNLWVATICEQMWVVNITSLIKGLKTTNIDTDKIDAKKVENLLKQWLLERDDMTVMHSIHKFTKRSIDANRF